MCRPVGWMTSNQCDRHICELASGKVNVKLMKAIRWERRTICEEGEMEEEYNFAYEILVGFVLISIFDAKYDDEDKRRTAWKLFRFRFNDSNQNTGHTLQSEILPALTVCLVWWFRIYQNAVMHSIARAKNQGVVVAVIETIIVLTWIYFEKSLFFGLNLFFFGQWRLLDRFGPALLWLRLFYCFEKT